MPPTRLWTLLYPFFSRNSATWRLRPPWWQMATMSFAWSSSSRRPGSSRIGTSCAPAMCARSYSQGSRTSSSTGLSRPASASHAASSGGVICFMPLEPEARRVLGVHERRHHGFEKIHAVKRPRCGARDKTRTHRRRLAHDGEEPPAVLELLVEGTRERGRRAGEHDDMVRRMALPAARRV